jgi:AraC-like DNA-binding protein
LLLPHGKAHADEISCKLGMSERSLARRLSREGLTLTRVLGDLKRELAKRYLLDEDLTISDIAWRLGYREASAFTHAFHRWFGKTPREMRSREALCPKNSIPGRDESAFWWPQWSRSMAPNAHLIGAGLDIENGQVSVLEAI